MRSDLTAGRFSRPPRRASCRSLGYRTGMGRFEATSCRWGNCREMSHRRCHGPVGPAADCQSRAAGHSRAAADDRSPEVGRHNPEVAGDGHNRAADCHNRAAAAGDHSLAADRHNRSPAAVAGWDCNIGQMPAATWKPPSPRPQQALLYSASSSKWFTPVPRHYHPGVFATVACAIVAPRPNQGGPHRAGRRRTSGHNCRYCLYRQFVVCPIHATTQQV